MGKRLAAPGLAAVVVAGSVLGLGRLGNAGAGPATSTLPATTTTSTSVPGAPPPASVPPIQRSAADADEPLCETRRDPPGDTDSTEAPPLRVLESEMSIVNTYGVPLGEEFHGAGMTWTDDGRRVVIAAFVADVAVHRAALEDLVADPDHLVVCRARLTRSEGAAIVAAVERELDDLESAFGPTGMDGRVAVRIRPGREATAESLHGAYGDQLAIVVGVLEYPMPDPPSESVCPGLPEPRGDLPFAGRDPAPIVLAAIDGVDVDVDVSFVNATQGEIAFLTGYPQAYLADPGSGEVVGVSILGIAAIGVPVDLAPGESHHQSVRVPTASCDPALGHTVPPGDYHLFAVNSAGDGSSFAVGPVPVTIAERR